MEMDKWHEAVRVQEQIREQLGEISKIYGGKWLTKTQIAIDQATSKNGQRFFQMTLIIPDAKKLSHQLENKITGPPQQIAAWVLPILESLTK